MSLRIAKFFLATSLIFLVLSGCSARFVCPTKGGPQWLELKSSHFLLRTDLSFHRARMALEQLEYMGAALDALISQPEEEGDRLMVIIFATRDEYVEFVGDDGTAGIFGKQLQAGEGAIVISGDLDISQRRVIAHELAHYVSFRVIARQPKWFAEGLASYFETIGEFNDTGIMSAGKMQPYYWRILGEGSVSARDVIEWGDVKGSEADYYAKSWLMFHYLTSHHAREFTAYKSRLARLEDPRSAWNAAFPAWSLAVPGATASLDERLENYRLVADFNRRDLTMAATSTCTVRALTSADVHTLRLYNRPRWKPEELESEIAEALAEDPGHVAALTVKTERQPQDALGLARLAVNSHPEDPFAWRLLGNALEPETALKEREEAFAQALRLSPNSPQSVFDMAMALSAQGRSKEALPLFRRTAKLAPDSLMAAYFHASTLNDLGLCKEAGDAAIKALSLLANEPEGQRAQFQEKLNQIKTKCGPRQAGRPSP